jgi:hypothetical protein
MRISARLQIIIDVHMVVFEWNSRPFDIHGTIHVQSGLCVLSIPYFIDWSLVLSIMCAIGQTNRFRNKNGHAYKAQKSFHFMLGCQTSGMVASAGKAQR